jgi:uncharacterized membrane protein
MASGTRGLSTGWARAEPRASARFRVGVAAAAAAVAALLGPWELAPLTGWDVAAVTYLTWMWRTIWPLDAKASARQALREDPGRAAADAVLLAASVASLLAVALFVARAGNNTGVAKGLQVAASVVSVVLSWSVVHTIFTLRYARLYYARGDGGVDFHQDDPPRFSDFAYLAFTIGMTFQVSDTVLTATDVRATALRHALLSYLFGAVILAMMINLVAGLTR